MTLEKSWDSLWALSYGLSQFHGHGSWLVCEVELSLLLGDMYVCVLIPLSMARYTTYGNSFLLLDTPLFPRPPGKYLQCLHTLFHSTKGKNVDYFSL